MNDRARGCQNPVTLAVPANATLAVIQGLNPTQEYCVTVAVCTCVGLGESSQMETVGCKCYSISGVTIRMVFSCCSLLLEETHLVLGHW